MGIKMDSIHLFSIWHSFYILCKQFRKIDLTLLYMWTLASYILLFAIAWLSPQIKMDQRQLLAKLIADTREKREITRIIASNANAARTTRAFKRP